MSITLPFTYKKLPPRTPRQAMSKTLPDGTPAIDSGMMRTVADDSLPDNSNAALASASPATPQPTGYVQKLADAVMRARRTQPDENKDASQVPASERMDAVMKAGGVEPDALEGVGSPIPPRPDASPAGATRPRFVNPPVITTDSQGRPVRSMHAPDTLASAEAVDNAVANYEPQPAKGWRRYLPVIFQDFLAGASGGGGLWGGAGGALTGLLTGAVDSRAANRMWKERAQSKADARLSRTAAIEKEDAESKLMRARGPDRSEEFS